MEHKSKVTIDTVCSTHLQAVSQGQLYRLGDTWDEGVRRVYPEAIGPHENLYRDIKRI